MRRTTLLALSLFFVCAWSQDSARGQNSATPPVSLAPPHATPPHAAAKNARPKGEPAVVTNDRTPPAAGREPSPPVIGAPPPPPNPAADYDGFSASTDDNDAPSQMAPPVKSRAAKGSSRDTNGLDAQSSIDQEDEALRRKLTICKNCK
nr:hypothetical protein [Bradyrhizobium sp. WSM3983]